jgi:uncharacterized membrane protein
MTIATPTAAPISLERFLSQRPALRDINQELARRLSPLDRIALRITTTVGTMGFFIVIFCWTVLWLGWNLLAPAHLRFDPPMGFVFWLFISNVVQLLLMPLIMVGQNLLSRHAEARAERDLEVNQQAEAEIQLIFQHLEYQNGLLRALLERGFESGGGAARD